MRPWRVRQETHIDPDAPCLRYVLPAIYNPPVNMSSQKPINWLIVGTNIRRNRVATGITQKALGKALGVSASMVCQMEKGKKHASNEQLYAIANRLDVTMDELARDLTAVERARLLVGLDLPLVFHHLDEAAAAIDKGRANARAIEAELAQRATVELQETGRPRRKKAKASSKKPKRKKS